MPIAILGQRIPSRRLFLEFSDFLRVLPMKIFEPLCAFTLDFQDPRNSLVCVVLLCSTENELVEIAEVG